MTSCRTGGQLIWKFSTLYNYYKIYQYNRMITISMLHGGKRIFTYLGDGLPSQTL